MFMDSSALRKVLPAIFSASRERTTQADVDATSATGSTGGAKTGGKTEDLDQYTVDLTENARKGKIDSVLGRDLEIRQMVGILTRRRQNNPMLTGEAGVGVVLQTRIELIW